VSRKPEGQPHEDSSAQHGTHRVRRGSILLWRLWGTRRGMAWYKQGMEWEAHREVQPSEHEQGVPPAYGSNEQLRQRHKDGAGKPAHEGQCRNAAACLRSKDRSDDGKGGLI